MKVYTIHNLIRLLGGSSQLIPAITSLIVRYDEPHRFYHTWQHIDEMLVNAEKEGILDDDLFLAIFFHDIIYNPKATDNEEKSAELFFSFFKNERVKQAILDTKTHKPTNHLSEKLCRLDLEILKSDFSKQIEFENKIFKEYQFVDWEVYREKRIEALKSLNAKPELIDYVRSRKPAIAIYCGSFNPMHVGHLNVLEKAEAIFDKVIIARGNNILKKDGLWELPKQIQFRQIESYTGLMTDFIQEFPYDVTVVRGLRNATDLQYETTQYKFLQYLLPNIKLVSIFCDQQYEHISSSAIRQLVSYGKGNEYLLS